MFGPFLESLVLRTFVGFVVVVLVLVLVSLNCLLWLWLHVSSWSARCARMGLCSVVQYSMVCTHPLVMVVFVCEFRRAVQYLYIRLMFGINP